MGMKNDVETDPRYERRDPVAIGQHPDPADATEDAIGYALKLLRTAGLVATRKQGRAVFYRLANDVPVPLRDHGLLQFVRLSRADGDTGREIGRAQR